MCFAPKSPHDRSSSTRFLAARIQGVVASLVIPLHENEAPRYRLRLRRHEMHKFRVTIFFSTHIHCLYSTLFYMNFSIFLSRSISRATIFSRNNVVREGLRDSCGKCLPRVHNLPQKSRTISCVTPELESSCFNASGNALSSIFVICT